MILRTMLALALAAASAVASAAPDPQSRLVIITLDGMRWQDVFRGPDKAMTEDASFTHPGMKEAVRAAWLDGPRPGAALMPFLHDVMGANGLLVGDRDHGQCMRVANQMWFSYPGYNEILTGKPDPGITSNDKVYNRNITILEWLNHQPGFAGKVAAFGTWDAFPYIINDKRSGVPVNAGLGMRFGTDAITARLALQAVKSGKPRVLFIGFGDTDELAHAGDYDQYLAAANRTDDVIQSLWEEIQANPAWRGDTTMIVTTDHGRGDRPDATWKDHASPTYLAMVPKYLPDQTKTGIVGSDAIWLAAIGPGVRRPRAVTAACLEQRQIASSALTALGIDWHSFDRSAGAPLPQFVP